MSKALPATLPGERIKVGIIVQWRFGFNGISDVPGTVSMETSAKKLSF